MLGIIYDKYLNFDMRLMIKNYLKLYSMFLFSTLLMGCGQMGPLYLPHEEINCLS